MKFNTLKGSRAFNFGIKASVIPSFVEGLSLINRINYYREILDMMECIIKNCKDLPKMSFYDLWNIAKDEIND